MKHVQIFDTSTLAALRSALTDLQARFAEEYLFDLNATKAAERAELETKNFGQAGHELLKKPDVAAYVSALQSVRRQRTMVDSDWVLMQAVRLHQRCMNEISIYVDRKGAPILDDEDNLQYVFNAAGAAKALELVGKHVGVQAFKENIGLTVGMVMIDPAAMSEEQLRALADVPLALPGPGTKPEPT